MQINIEQVWEYEFKPTDTMRLLHAFKNVWELNGSEITLERRGNRIFAVRREKDTEEDLLSKAFGRNPLDSFPSIRKDK
jgi:hypothetical protein